MDADSPRTGPRDAAPRRTVLLALHWENERLTRGIVDHARREGWHLLSLRYYEMDLPRAFRPDGVLLFLPRERRPLARRMLRLGVPAVQIQDYVPRLSCPSVVMDRVAHGRMAAEHFLERGFRSVAYLRYGPRGQPNAKLNWQSFLDRARAGGAKARLLTMYRKGRPIDWTKFADISERVLAEIAHCRFPLGIFAFNDVMAVRVCHICDEAGIAVPEQVAVLGVGNDPLHCDCASVPVSSVDPDRFAQGWTAAELLGRLMAGQDPPAEPILIPPKAVVARQSTDILALPDPDVARALRYIWVHYAEPLTVTDIAEAAAVSRRKLERHFRQHLGRTVNAELNRKRIERCCELLTGTNQTVTAIAREVGFQTELYLFRVFRKVLGMTPRQYRLREQTASKRLARLDGPAAIRRGGDT